MVTGADGAKIAFSIAEDALQIRYRAQAGGSAQTARTIFFALDLGGGEGSAILPFEEKLEGSTVFLPFRANKFYAIQSGGDSDKEWRRVWKKWKWSERVDTSEELVVQHDDDELMVEFPHDELSPSGKLKLVIYAKDFTKEPWGRFFGCSDLGATGGQGDQYIPHYLELDLKAAPTLAIQRRGRLEMESNRLRIYQLFVRLFSNTNETRKENGTLEENGVGKFSQISDAALASIKQMGFNHVWLTGVVQQASGTDYSGIGQPADDADLLKGVAGSPYAIKDYFDVSPDYAEKPEERIEEFQALLGRMRRYQLKALIDFVPNHVARSYQSDVIPGLDFGVKGQDGRGDDVTKFFDPQNNFFYLKPGDGGPPLRLPTGGGTTAVSSGGTGRDSARPSSRDGLFAPEEKIGRVTGNNVVSWRPGLNDWYETVKLNYGFDFTAPAKNVREYPSALAPEKPLPDTWKKMDQVLAYWQGLGVDGFRCDMAHMVPPEFWHWAIGRARQRHPEAIFIAEAYDNDPAKVPGSDPVISKLNGGKSNVMFDLLNAGFNAVYDDPTYKALKNIYDGPGWANDLDGAVPDAFVFDNSLRYAENHDEVRLAATNQWGGVGMNVGLPVSAILYGLSRGPAIMYHGQEVGEPGAGVEGFGSDDARTSIFDYWSMPELAKWVNSLAYDGGKLSRAQADLRGSYSKLLRVIAEPAFRDGATFPLNKANIENPGYGRLGSEKPSGHWLYAFLRYDVVTGQRFLVAVNLHRTDAMKNVRIRLPEATEKAVGMGDPARKTDCSERLGLANASAVFEKGEFVVSEIPPLTPFYFEVQ